MVVLWIRTMPHCADASRSFVGTSIWSVSFHLTTNEKLLAHFLILIIMINLFVLSINIHGSPSIVSFLNFFNRSIITFQLHKSHFQEKEKMKKTIMNDCQCGFDEWESRQRSVQPTWKLDSKTTQQRQREACVDETGQPPHRKIKTGIYKILICSGGYAKEKQAFEYEC